MRLGIFLLFLILFNLAFGQVEPRLLKEVKLTCDTSKTCELLKPRFSSLEGKHFNLSALKFELKSRLFEQLIETFEYKVLLENDNYLLEISLTTRKKVNNIKITSAVKGVPLDGLLNLMPIQEGQFYNSDLIAAIPSAVSKYLFDVGVVDSEVDLKVKPNESDVDLEINISAAKLIRINKIRWFFNEKEKVDLVRAKINRLGGKVYNRKEVNVIIEQISKEIFDEGYPFSDFKIRDINISSGNTGIGLDFSIKLGEKTIFDISGNTLLSRSELLNQIKNKIKDQGFLTKNQLIKFTTDEITEAYQDIGIFNTKVNVGLIEGYDSKSEKIKTYYIKIKEGKKIRVADIFFTGNRFFSDDYLKDIYFEKGTSLSKNKYLDNTLLGKFKEQISEEYLKNGFLSIDVAKPKIEYVGKTNQALISVRIRENRQTVLSDINFSPDVQELFKEEIKKLISNHVGSPLDVTKLDNDIDEIEKFLKSQGYLFVKIKNKESENIITYNTSLSTATLFLDIELGKKSFFNAFYVSGNIKTKDDVFQRESFLKIGELLTWEKLNLFIERVSNTGLFKEVKIYPRPVESVPYGEGSQLVDLVVEVAERDFANLELGPGFRTDLGLRLAAKFKLINVSGLGRRLSFRGELNQRLNENIALAPARQGLYPLAFLEYYVDAKYEEPHLGNSPMGMDIMASLGRRRYRTFDSDIFLSGITFGEVFSWFSPILRYQFENDYQYNAVYEKDQGTFRIASLTPSFSFDFRDRRVSPTKGFFLSLLGEFASPWLGSINTNNYEINFFSLISRNNFYYPFSYNWVGAMYLSAGFQKNLATEPLLDASGNPVVDQNTGIPTTKGYIPTVKVFRLEGSDNVRGYKNSEINILSNGIDIGQVVVDDTAYYLNIKLEARHFVSDSFVIFPFLDAGSIQINSWVPFELKTAVGLGFKYLTPMGSLELDFGIKTHRNEGESFGAIELMIGYF